jgi:hypothetical protein
MTMKKYIPYIVLGLVLVAGGIYYAVSAQKGNAPQNTNTADHASQGHDSPGQPVAQSHRSYNVQVTSNTSSIKPGQTTKITFKVLNDRQEVLKDFTVAHEKLMHFILVRKDLQHFQHLHPDFNQQTGEFSVNVNFPTDGPYRLYPDFTPTPENPQKLPVTLTYDVNVGDMSKYRPQAVTPDTGIEKAVGGYTVTHYMPETLKSQTQFDYSLVVEEPNALVTLEPYLGAMGHGVIIKEGTLDFIHTHAEGMDMAGMEGMSAGEHAGHMPEPDTIAFSTNFPEPGTYKIFTQFQAKGKVVTTHYTIKVE